MDTSEGESLADEWIGSSPDEDDMFDFFSGQADLDTTSQLPDESVGQEWQWVPLVEPEDIRIFDIEPSADEGVIHCSFRATSLNTPAEYFALSYAWGQTYADRSHLTHTIHCDGWPVQVTETLYQALRRIRCLKYSNEANKSFRISALWVDAICIDQGNILERGRQVMLMGRIYKAAQHVMVWLGELNLSLTLHDGSNLDSAVLRRQPYFTRRWVIQELALSRSPHSILAGPNHAICSNLLSFLQKRTAVLKLRARGSCGRELWTGTIPNSLNLKWNCLLQNLVDFYDFKCSDDRDRVFALRHMSCDGRHLVVDYRMTPEQLYTSLAIHWVRCGHLMSVLICAVQTSRVADRQVTTDDVMLPSWVPDWRDPRESRSFGAASALVSSGLDGHGRNEVYTSAYVSSSAIGGLEDAPPFPGTEIVGHQPGQVILCLSLRGILFSRCDVHVNPGARKALGLPMCRSCFFSGCLPPDGPLDRSHKGYTFGRSHRKIETFCVLENRWMLGLEPGWTQGDDYGGVRYSLRRLYRCPGLAREDQRWTDTRWLAVFEVDAVPAVREVRELVCDDWQEILIS